MTTAGNPDTHVILRGGRGGPNYEASHVAKALDLISGAGLPRRLMVDASHGNSGKDHRRQPLVAAAIAEQVGGRRARPDRRDAGELPVDGKQEPGPPATLTYGQSVDRRVHGLRDHRRRPGQPGRRRPFPARFLYQNGCPG